MPMAMPMAMPAHAWAGDRRHAVTAQCVKVAPVAPCARTTPTPPEAGTAQLGTSLGGGLATRGRRRARDTHHKFLL